MNFLKVFLTVTLLCAGGCSLQAMVDETDDAKKPLPRVNEESMFTIEETLGLLFVRPLHGREHRPDVYLYANPKAKPYVYQMLKNKTLLPSREVDRILSVIFSNGGADENDFKYVQIQISKFKKRKKGNLSFYECCRVRFIHSQLLELCKQEVKGSEKLRKSILDIKFWKDSQFRTEGDTLSTYSAELRSAECHMVSSMIELYQWPNKKLLNGDLAKIAQDFKGHKGEKFMNKVIQKKKDSFTPPPKKSRKRQPAATYGNDAGDGIKWTYKDYLYWKNTAAAAFNSDLKNPGPAKHPGPAKQVQKNGDREAARLGVKTEAVQKTPKPKSDDTVRDKLTQKEKDKLIKEAQKELVVLKKLLITEKHAPFLKRVLDNSKRIDSRKLKNAGAYQELVSDLFLTKKVTQEVFANKPNVGNKTFSQKTITSAENKKTIVTTVTWELQGTKEVVSKYRNWKSSRGATVSKNGNAVIYMKKINGKWYWQPFGW